MVTRFPKMIYRYRSLTIQNIEAVCEDELFFSRPLAFNDPFDSNPLVESDSSNEELRAVLERIVSDRVYTEVISRFNGLRINDCDKKRIAKREARNHVENILSNIDYNASDPEYDMPIEDVKNTLLKREIERELVDNSDHGICCFASSYKIPLMWSHYADMHKGFCVGYDFNRNPEPKAYPVTYGGSRVLRTSVVREAILDGDVQSKEFIKTGMFLIKSRQWQYEKEFRMFNSPGLHDSPLRMIDITFGLRCSTPMMYTVVSMLKSRSMELDFYEMREVRGEFKIKRVPLEQDELFWRYPRISQSGEEIFGHIV